MFREQENSQVVEAEMSYCHLLGRIGQVRRLCLASIDKCLIAELNRVCIIAVMHKN